MASAPEGGCTLRGPERTFQRHVILAEEGQWTGLSPRKDGPLLRKPQAWDGTAHRASLSDTCDQIVRPV